MPAEIGREFFTFQVSKSNNSI